MAATATYKKILMEPSHFPQVRSVALNQRALDVIVLARLTRCRAVRLLALHEETAARTFGSASVLALLAFALAFAFAHLRCRGAPGAARDVTRVRSPLHTLSTAHLN